MNKMSFLRCDKFWWSTYKSQHINIREMEEHIPYQVYEHTCIEKCRIELIFCEIQSENHISLESTQIIEIVVILSLN